MTASAGAPTVSVILPVYNRMHALEDSIRSVLAQSYADLELIVVDDASTEDLSRVIGRIDDPRLRYVRLEVNGGASAARNAGLAEARGDFIAFQDSDDLWLPRKLEQQMRVLEQRPEIDVVTNAKVLYGGGPDGSYGIDKVSLRPPPDGRLREDEDQVAKFLVENRISLQNALFRRNCYPEPVWFDARVRSNADWAFTSSLAQHARILELPEPVVMAFSSTDSISKNKRAKAIGLVRIMRRNRALYDRYPREYALNLWRLGRALINAGKRRTGWRFCRAALRHHPPLAARILGEKLSRTPRL